MNFEIFQNLQGLSGVNTSLSSLHHFLREFRPFKHVELFEGPAELLTIFLVFFICESGRSLNYSKNPGREAVLGPPPLVFIISLGNLRLRVPVEIFQCPMEFFLQFLSVSSKNLTYECPKVSVSFGNSKSWGNYSG